MSIHIGVDNAVCIIAEVNVITGILISECHSIFSLDALCLRNMRSTGGLIGKLHLGNTTKGTMSLKQFYLFKDLLNISVDYTDVLLKSTIYMYIYIYIHLLYLATMSTHLQIDALSSDYCINVQNLGFLKLIYKCR